MSDEKRQEFVDELLDASLRRYSQVEPRRGLEERLLANVPEQAQRFAWPSWVWIPAAATAAILLAALAFYATRQAAPPPSAPSVAQQVPSAPVAPTMSAKATPPAPYPNVSRVRVERMASPGRLGAGPRLASFPARAPISEQERLLLQFMQQTPKEQLMARQLGAAPIERLDFKPLAVPPLELEKPTTEN